MKNFRQVLLGVLIAIISLFMVIGSITLALAEGQINGAPFQLPVTDTRIPSPTEIIEIDQPTSTPIVNTNPVPPNDAATLPPTEKPPTPTHTAIPSSASCPAPQGWSPIIINPGDTLFSLSMKFGKTIDQLMEANCLLVAVLQPGSIFFVPSVKPTATLTTAPEVSCGHPSSWKLYTIQPKDTLYSLGKSFGTTYQELQFANCLGTSTNIRAGDKLWVPNVSTITPTFTKTIKSTKTETPSSSKTPTTTATATPTATP